MTEVREPCLISSSPRRRGSTFAVSTLDSRLRGNDGSEGGNDGRGDSYAAWRSALPSMRLLNSVRLIRSSCGMRGSALARTRG